MPIRQQQKASKKVAAKKKSAKKVVSRKAQEKNMGGPDSKLSSYILHPHLRNAVSYIERDLKTWPAKVSKILKQRVEDLDIALQVETQVKIGKQAALRGAPAILRHIAFADDPKASTVEQMKSIKRALRMAELAEAKKK
jgi:hypothetical protein